MKKHISLILTGLLLIVTVSAQTPETLTNSSVIKMSRANLSDELIIDMIDNSPVNFDLSPGAIKNLESEGVSAAVIQLMKNAPARKSQPGVAGPAGMTKPDPVMASPVDGTPEPSGRVPSKTVSEASVIALNYTAPLTGLIEFNGKEFDKMELAIAEWDKQVRGYIADINKVKSQMLQVENDLRSMKNADTKAFSNDILSMKGKLEAYRKNYRQSKDIMIKGGGNIVKQIETMSGDAVKNIGKAYSEASQKVSSADLDPEAGEMPVPLSYTTKEAGAGCVSYIVYLNEMMAWYQNEIVGINNLIMEWNPRVSSLLQEDAMLRSQAEPIEKRITELSANSRQNKGEISDLKKQISGIEKSRKQLADRMKDDAKELGSSLKQRSQASQAAVEQRFNDIIENITYSFGEKLSL